jgi:hypothetical protein
MTCGRTHLLEAVVSGEAPSLEVELRAHAASCALCRHELNWLTTERALFRHRAGRDEVAHLWKGVASAAPPPPRPWARLMVELAAIAVLVVGLGRLTQVSYRPADLAAAALEAPNESEPLSSEPLLDERCSKLPTGLGFHCGPAIPASFVASR